MAQTPAQRRAQRDAYARSLTDPRTGQPFKNYNALDTYQRNEKAKQRGFTSRAAERGARERAQGVQGRGKNVREAEERFPLSWERFLGDQKPTERLAKDFLKAFGPYPNRPSELYKIESEELRQAYIDALDNRGIDWDWRLWRHEYAAA